MTAIRVNALLGALLIGLALAGPATAQESPVLKSEFIYETAAVPVVSRFDHCGNETRPGRGVVWRNPRVGS